MKYYCPLRSLRKDRGIYNLQCVPPADLASLLKIRGTVRAQSLQLVGGAGETFPIKIGASKYQLGGRESCHTATAKLDLLEGFDKTKTISLTVHIYEPIIFDRELSKRLCYVKGDRQSWHRSTQ